MTTEVTVVGGGVVGLAIAYEALRRGLTVELVTQSNAGEATSAAGGMLAPIAEADPCLAPLVELGLESLRMYPRWIEELEATVAMSCDFRRCGSMLVALHADHVAELQHTQTKQTSLGLTATWLEARELSQVEPNISPRQQGALRIDDECAVDPRKLRAALSAAFDRRGGRRVDAGNGGITVWCQGAWTQDLPIRPVKGQALRLRGEPLLNHVVRTPDVYLVPRADGVLYVGATSEERGFEAQPTAGATFTLLRDATRAVPGVAELFLEEVIVGFRPTLRDHLPAIGFVRPGRIVATGHHRNGVLLAPVTAKLVVDAIESGVADPRLGPFDPKRFSERGTS